MENAIENLSEDQGGNAMDVATAFDCAGWIDEFLGIAYVMLWIALVLGALYVLASVIGAFRKPPRVDGREDGGGVIDAVTGLVAALAKAPAWFALFIAGLALLWVASSQIPAICRPAGAVVMEPEAEPAESPAPAATGVPDREA